MAAEVRTGRRPPATETLLDREVELSTLAALLAGAAAGRGGLGFVEGAPGVGKSALLEYATGTAQGHGLRLLRARGHELERSCAWGVARSLLEGPVGAERETLLAGPVAPARVVFEAGEAPAAEGGFAILHALYRLAVSLAQTGPLLLVVDDAHWADEPSLRFLAYLAGRLSDQPIGVLVGARTGAGELLDRLAAEPAAHVCALAPLGPAAVAALVRRRLGSADEAFCRRCFELTAGNPLQVRELLLALGQQDGRSDGAALAAGAELAARSLGRSVLLRLSALSPGAQALARAVAVLEDDAPLHLAAPLAELEPAAALSAADELMRADLLRLGDPLGFTHPLLRAAVYGALESGERSRTHRRAARLLIEAGAAGEQVSAHLLQSPPAGDAVVVDVLRAAARRALGQGVPGSASRYLTRALAEPPAEAARAGVLADLGRAEALAGRPEAVGYLESAIEMASAPRERAALLLDLGRVLHHHGRVVDASASFQRGLDELGDERDELALDLEGGYLTAAMHVPDRAADAQRRGDVILAGTPPASRAERALASKAMLMRLFAGAPRAGVLTVAHRLYGEGRMVAEDGAGSQALTHVINALSWCDDFRTADAALGLTFAEARRRGSPLTFAMASQLRARQRLWTGPVTGAVDDARAAVEIWRGGSQAYLHSSVLCLVCGLLERDDPDAAEAVLALGDGQPVRSGVYAAWRHAAAGRLAAHRGDDAGAFDAFVAAGGRLTGLQIVNPTMLSWRSDAALAAHRIGRSEVARELVAEELALAARFGAPRALAAARRAAGLLERGEAAVKQLRAAAALLAASGARVEHARTLIDLGAAVRRARRPVDARPTLREALVLADAAGATALARSAREEIRLAGGRAPAAARIQTGGLTPSEHRVATMAAAGQSNREIADALFITVKAVEWHLGNTYRKLGIRGRGELATALAPPT